MATQNPVEQEGTYPLPEAQLDRFLFKLVVGYPTEAEYHDILNRTTTSEDDRRAESLHRRGDHPLRGVVRSVPVPEHVQGYAIRLVMATQPGSEYAPAMVNEFVSLGSSPRGAQSLLLAGKVRALLGGRFAVSCDDVRDIAMARPASPRHGQLPRHLRRDHPRPPDRGGALRGQAAQRARRWLERTRPCPPLTKEEIFDPAFLASLSHLRVVARRVPRDGRFAEQRSRDLGHGTDFRDFRPYAAGDDFRAIDWNIYQRLGRVFLRLYEELEDLPLYLMPDISRSLFLESPPRALAGLRTTLALASISLNHHDSTGLFPFSNDCEILARPQSGRGKVMLFADRLAHVRARRADRHPRRDQALQQLRACGAGCWWWSPTSLIRAASEAVIAALKQVRHKLLLVQLHRRSDAEPDVRGDVRLIDCESREAEDRLDHAGSDQALPPRSTSSSRRISPTLPRAGMRDCCALMWTRKSCRSWPGFSKEGGTSV